MRWIAHRPRVARAVLGVAVGLSTLVAVPARAGAEGEEADAPEVHSLGDFEITPISPQEMSTIGGDVTVVVHLEPEDRADAEVQILDFGPDGYSADDNVWYPMAYDAVSGDHSFTLDTRQHPDRMQMDWVVTADFHDGRDASLRFGGVVRNQPRIQVLAPTPEAEWYSASGVEAVSVRATDLQDAPGTLRVVMATDGFPDQRLTYNLLTGRYEGTWDTRAVDAASHVAQTFTATDSDGMSITSEHHVNLLNIPTIAITKMGVQSGNGSIVPFEFNVGATAGGTAGLDITWYVDGKQIGRGGTPAFLGAERGAMTGNLPVPNLASGTHTLRLDVIDLANGKRNTTQAAFAIQHQTTFGIDILTPQAETSLAPQKIDVITYRPKPGGGLMRGYYRVDQKGDWKPMVLGLDGHLTAPWNPTRAKAGYDSHVLEVIAGDGVNLSYARSLIQALAAKPLKVYLPPQTVDSGVATIWGQISGGALAYDPSSPITAYYRVDEGDWMPLDTRGNTFQPYWDTREIPTGGHVIEVVAGDARGGLAYAKVIDIVRTRLHIGVLAIDWGDTEDDPATVVLLADDLPGGIGTVNLDSDRTIFKGYVRLVDDTFVETYGGPFLYLAELDTKGRPDGSEVHVQIVVTTPNKDDLAVLDFSTTIQRGVDPEPIS